MDSQKIKRLGFWCAISSTIILALIVGFFPHGGLHGQYMDDYFLKTWSLNFSDMKWKPTLLPHPPGDPINLRPLVYLLTPNLAHLLPEHELPVRIAILLVHLLNVFLLAKLGQRLTKSPLVGLIAGALFLFPVIANEGLLWFTAAVADTLALFLLLIGFHLILSCQSLAGNLPRLIIGVGAWTFGIMFYESGILTLVLLPLCFGMIQPERPSSNRKLCVAAMAGAYFPLGLYAAYIALNSPIIAARGGVTLNPVFVIHKIPAVARNLIWLVTDWGISGPLRDALKLGWREWTTVPIGAAILSLLILGLCLITVLFSGDEKLRQDQALSADLKLALMGLAWMAMGFVPILVLRSQIVEIRTLYIPFAGLVLCVAALCDLIANASDRWRAVATRAILLTAGAAIFSTSLSMAGLVRAYELRWQLDEKQIAAMRPVLAQFDRAEPLWLLPVMLDERILGDYSERETVLDRYLFGVFEHSGSAQDALRLKFGDRNIHVVAAQHWDKLHFTSVRPSWEGITQIVVQGEAVPVDHLVAFTYRQRELILLDPIQINDPDRNLSAVINLPLIPHLAGIGLNIEKVHFQIEHQD